MKRQIIFFLLIGTMLIGCGNSNNNENTDESTVITNTIDNENPNQTTIVENPNDDIASTSDVDSNENANYDTESVGVEEENLDDTFRKFEGYWQYGEGDHIYQISVEQNLDDSGILFESQAGCKWLVSVTYGDIISSNEVYDYGTNYIKFKTTMNYGDEEYTTYYKMTLTDENNLIYEYGEADEQYIDSIISSNHTL